MGILDKFFNQTTTVDLVGGWSTANSLSSSGAVVTSENALNLATVYACVNVKANALAKLPINIYQKTDSGRIRVGDHAVARLLETRPNPYMTPYVFKHTAQVHRNIYGVAYVRMVFDRAGKPNALYLLNPTKVSVAVNEKDEYFYIEATDDKQKPNVYGEEEIIRLPYLTTDGFTPKSPIAVARETIGTLKKQQTFLGSFYSNGTLTRGVLKVPTALSKDAKEKVRQAWMDANSGEDNASRIAVLDSGVEFNNISIPLNDAEFIASQKFGVEEIARIYNVPLSMINSLDRATFSNIEQQSMDFVQNTLSPELIAWEEELNYKLFTRLEQDKGFYVKFNLASALRGDSQSRAAYYKTMLESGVYSINEVRALEEKDAIAYGDDHYRSLNFITLDNQDYQRSKGGES